jgi:hypothetical protein
MRLLLLLVVVLALGSCADPANNPRPPHAATSNPSRTKAPPEGGAAKLLVWARAREADDGTTTTFRLAANGEVLDRSPGLRIATARGEWTWTTRRTEVRTDPCDFDTPIPPQESWVTSASLVGPGGVEQQIVRAKPEAEGANELHHQVDLVASLGPILFVEQTSWSYSCGAHGSQVKEFTVWDAERARALDVVHHVPDASLLMTSAKAALEGDDAGAFAASPPEITEIVPVLRGDQLTFEAQVTIASCYACGDGLWSSYTRSKRVAAKPPAELVRYAVLPRAVVAFAAAHPDLLVGGWSRGR